MNGWDIFTWINAVGLSLGAVVIFAGFLRDTREVLNRPEGKEK